MKHAELLLKLENEPVIAAVGDDETTKKCLTSSCGIVFVLYGSILSIQGIVSQLKDAKKTVFVHIDLISGLAPHEVAPAFIKQYTRADGIISTRAPLIKAAKECGLLAVQRFFLLDSHALKNIRALSPNTSADMIEVLPAVSPRTIARLAQQIRLPLIVGGLIEEKEDVISMLDAGADAISTSCADIWDL